MTIKYLKGFLPISLIILVFIISRIYYHLQGIDMSLSPINYYWQYIDLELLKHNFLESLFYHYHQPPGFNILLGLTVKAFPVDFIFFLSIFYKIAGLLAYISLYLLCVELKMPKPLSFLLSTLFFISPTCICYENWLFYSYLIICLLIYSSLFMTKYLTNEKTAYLIFFILSLFLLYSIKTSFQYYYFLFSLLFVLVPSKNKKKILLISSLPLILILSINFKNYILFNQFSTGHTTTRELAIKTLRKFPKGLTDKLITEKKITVLRNHKVNDVITNYPPEYSEVKTRFQNIPVLSEPLKKNGYINQNHIGYIKLTNDYLHDCFIAAKEYPKIFFTIYFNDLKSSWNTYLLPGSSYIYTDHNYKKIYHLPINKFYQRVLYGNFDFKDKSFYFLKYGIVYLLIFGISLPFTRTFKNMHSAHKAVLFFMIFNIIYIGSTAILVASLEHNRYRVTTDPFYLVLLGVLIKHYLVPFIKELNK